MRIASWNVNSINARADTVAAWFKEAQPDVACLQEIKCVDEAFPKAMFEDLGYNVAVHGQKSYNGVALLSKTPLEDVRRGPHVGRAGTSTCASVTVRPLDRHLVSGEVLPCRRRFSRSATSSVRGPTQRLAHSRLGGVDGDCQM